MLSRNINGKESVLDGYYFKPFLGLNLSPGIRTIYLTTHYSCQKKKKVCLNKPIRGLTSSMTNKKPCFLRSSASSTIGAKSPSMLNKLQLIR